MALLGTEHCALAAWPYERRLQMVLWTNGETGPYSGAMIVKHCDYLPEFSQIYPLTRTALYNEQQKL
jgi:hypothetical protein